MYMPKLLNCSRYSVYAFSSHLLKRITCTPHNRQRQLHFSGAVNDIDAAVVRQHGLAENSISDNHQSSNHILDVDENVLHKPVLVDDVVNLIKPCRGQVILDMTFGAGGHTKALLQQCSEITVYALDRDPCAFKLAQQLSHTYPQVKPLLGRFTDIHHLMHTQETMKQVDVVLFDCGVSSMQFDSSERGFSINADGPLDMRMDPNCRTDQLTAEDVVNHMSEHGLHGIIKKYGEEKRAKHIARAIVDSRYAFGRITTTSQLAAIVAGVYDGHEKKSDKLHRPAHVATKTFQALRIFVNNELNELHNGLNVAHTLLSKGGLCVAITFHSLEDRLVKRHFHNLEFDSKSSMSVTDRHRNPSVIFSASELNALIEQRWKPFSKQVLLPTENEIDSNPRARSAKLRAAWKL